uniref:Uncharacterized protein n=1 Tax=Ficedula albicollis TaxID=59894 RepID=A0A803VGI8_FICAL
MALSNHTNSSSVLPNLLHMSVEQKKALRFNNYSNPALELQEEIMASFYILIIVGFFGFLLFVMMLSNIVSSKPENYMDYLYSGKLSPAQGQVEWNNGMRFKVLQSNPFHAPDVPPEPPWASSALTILSWSPGGCDTVPTIPNNSFRA